MTIRPNGFDKDIDQTVDRATKAMMRLERAVQHDGIARLNAKPADRVQQIACIVGAKRPHRNSARGIQPSLGGEPEPAGKHRQRKQGREPSTGRYAAAPRVRRARRAPSAQRAIRTSVDSGRPEMSHSAARMSG